MHTRIHTRVTLRPRRNFQTGAVPVWTCDVEHEPAASTRVPAMTIAT